MNDFAPPAAPPATRLLPLLVLSLLAACGGGGGGSSATSPTADAGDDLVVDAGSSVRLEGSGTDSDGSVSGYSWKQTGGPDVTLDNADRANLAFTAPDVAAAETLTFELTVTDNDGSTGKDSVEVAVAPVIELSGIVYDGPIANATVTVTVGDRTYTATANADGSYSVNVGAIDPDAFITIQATGAEGQEQVELLSIAGSFGALQAAAGDDGVLDESDSGSVNVTNVSTAKAVLMIQANGGNDIADDETLATAESNVSGDDLLYLATVIKLVIDGGHDLPSGVDSTLDLVRSASKTETFVATVDAADATAFDTMYETLVNDSKLMAAFTSSNVPAELFTIYVSSNDDRSLTYRVTNRGKAWTFGANNRGTRSDADYASAPFSWAITNGKIVVTYDTPLAGAGNCTHPDDPSGWLYYCESTTTKTTFTLVNDGATADSLLLSNTGETVYPSDPGLAQPVAMTGGSTNLGLQKSAAIPFAAADVPGRWIASTSGRAPGSLSGVMFSTLDSGFLEFDANGTGVRTATDRAPSETFTWKVNDGVLEVTYAGGDVVKFFRMRRDGNVYDTLALLTRHEGGRHSDAGLMLEVDVARLPLLALEDVPGRYALFEMQDSFNIRFDESGTGRNERFNGSAMADAEGFSWTLRDDYVVEMKYYWNVGDTYDTTCLDAGTCHNWMDRLWYPAAYDDATGRVYVLEIQQYYDWVDANPESKGPLNQYQPTVRYFGRTELDAMAAVMGKAAAPGATGSALRMRSVLGTPGTRSR